MDWGNVIVKSVSPDLVTVDPNLDGDYKKTKKKLTWLSCIAPNPDATLVPLTLHDYDFLIVKKKLEEGDEVKDFVNPKTIFAVHLVSPHFRMKPLGIPMFDVWPKAQSFNSNAKAFTFVIKLLTLKIQASQ